MRDELGELLFMVTLVIFSFVVIGLVVFVFYLKLESEGSNHAGDYESFEEFKARTVLLEGKVAKAEKENRFLRSDKYNLVVNDNKGTSKIVEVNEKQYRNYQKGADVKFRIDKKANNEVVLDLNNENDVNNKKAFKKKYDDKSEHWDWFS